MMIKPNSKGKRTITSHDEVWLNASNKAGIPMSQLIDLLLAAFLNDEFIVTVDKRILIVYDNEIILDIGGADD